MIPSMTEFFPEFFPEFFQNFFPEFFPGPICVSGINRIKWVKIFKIGPSKICGRQPLKNLK